MFPFFKGSRASYPDALAVDSLLGIAEVAIKMKSKQWEELEADFRKLHDPKYGLHAFANTDDERSGGIGTWTVFSHREKSGDKTCSARYERLFEAYYWRGWKITGCPNLPNRATSRTKGSGF